MRSLSRPGGTSAVKRVDPPGQRTLAGSQESPRRSPVSGKSAAGEWKNTSRTATDQGRYAAGSGPSARLPDVTPRPPLPSNPERRCGPSCLTIRAYGLWPPDRLPGQPNRSRFATAAPTWEVLMPVPDMPESGGGITRPHRGSPPVLDVQGSDMLRNEIALVGQARARRAGVGCLATRSCMTAMLYGFEFAAELPLEELQGRRGSDDDPPRSDEVGAAVALRLAQPLLFALVSGEAHHR